MKINKITNSKKSLFSLCFILFLFAGSIFFIHQTFAASSTWTGATSTDWNTANNWSPAAVPNSSADVIIPDAGTTPNDPNISANAVCGTMTIQTNGVLNGNGQTITAYGNWTNGGTFSHGGGKVVLAGSGGNSTFTPGGSVYSDLEINKNGNTYADRLILSGNATVSGNLIHSGGVIEAGQIDLAGNYTIGANSHIVYIGGAAVINFNHPSNDQSITYNGGGVGARVRIDKAGGNFNVATNVAVMGWEHVRGAVSGLDSHTLTFSGAKPGTFIPGSLTYGSVAVNKTGGTYFNTFNIGSGTLNISGDLILSAGILNLTSNPAINVTGNLSVASGVSFNRGSGTLTFVGTAPSTFIDHSTTAQDVGKIAINKTNSDESQNKLTLLSSMACDTLTIDGTVGQKDTLDLGTSGYTFTLAGSSSDVFTVNGYLLVGNSTIRYSAVNSAGDVNITPLAYNQLILSGAETYIMAGNVTVSGDFTINSGATLVLGGNLTLSGNFINSGTIIPNAGTVTLAGSNQSLSGNNTFYNLTKIAASADTLTFQAGSTTAIVSGGALVLQGSDASGLLSLRSSSASTAYSINLDNNSRFDLSYLDIQDSTAGGKALSAYLSNDSGRNTSWTIYDAGAPASTIVPQESAHFNSNTFSNLNTIVSSLGSIDFFMTFDSPGDIKWYKDGVLVKTDSNASTSDYTASWTSSDCSQVKEMKVLSTNAIGDSASTIWKVEVEDPGNGTITKTDSLNVTAGSANLSALYLASKQADNSWIEYVEAKTYIVKKSINAIGATLVIDNTTAKDIYLQGLPIVKNITASAGANIQIDKVNFYGWDVVNDREISLGNTSPSISSSGNNQMDVTNSNLRHILVAYSSDTTRDDIVDNNSFFEGNSFDVAIFGSEGKIVTNNDMRGATTNCIYTGDRFDYLDGNVIQNNRSYMSPDNGENMRLAQGGSLIGNEIYSAAWNLVEYPGRILSKNNNLHTNSIHNGLNGFGTYSYSINDYVHDFTIGETNFFYIQVWVQGTPFRWPHDIYMFNNYTKGNRPGIEIQGAYNVYMYNYTSDGSWNTTKTGSDNIIYRKSNLINSQIPAITSVDVEPEIYGHVGNTYVIDSEFANNVVDYQINAGTITSINSFRRNSNGTITSSTSWGGFRSYAYLDTLVQDSSGNPISGATVTITALTDTNLPPVKVNLPPPPPDLETYPPEQLPMPTVTTFDSIQTDTAGHTPKPNYGWSSNVEATPALLYKRDNTVNYQYRITATYGGNTVYKDVTPDFSWIREDPTQPSKTVVLTLNKEAGKTALNINSGSGSGLYTAGEIINIAAATAPSGKVFDKWIGDTTGIANVSLDSTTITVQSTDASLAPYYKDITYHLTVNGGTGSGDYPAGKIVVADAESTSGTQAFHKWTGNGADHVVSPAVYSSTLIMPNHDLTVTATYRNPVSYSCHLTVADGTGTDFCAPGDTISISADTPPVDKVFDHWAGDTDNLTNPSSSSTTLTDMPDEYLILYPVYIDSGITATPTFSPQGGTYTSSQTVSITDATNGAIIHYTTDNSIPNASSPVYSTGISVTQSTTIKAIAIKTGYTDSSIESATYTITTATATPTFSPSGGTYTSAQSVSITSATANASIYYTNNGSTPTISSTHYTTPITLSSTTTLKAIAIKAGYVNSAITTAIYTINIPSSGGGTPSGGGGGSGSGGGGTTSLTPVIVKTEIKSLVGNLLTLNLSVNNASQMMLSDTSSFLGSNWINYTNNPTYTKQLTQTKLYLKFKSSTGIISSTVELTIPPIITDPSTGGDTANLYPTGTLLKLSDSFKVYVIIDNKKKWISTPEVFEQLGYKWTEIKILTQTELNNIPDFEDNLIRAINDYKVYLVVNGVKRHIPNPIIFLDYGFKWEEVKDVPQSTIDKYKNTYLIKQSGSNGIYYVNPQEIRKLIPNTEVFNSYNDKTADIQIISKTEMDFYPLSNLIKLNGSNDIYLIEGNIKKRIPNPTIFNKYKLNWNLVMSVNQTEFNFYSDGGELK